MSAVSPPNFLFRVCSESCLDFPWWCMFNVVIQRCRFLCFMFCFTFCFFDSKVSLCHVLYILLHVYTFECKYFKVLSSSSLPILPSIHPSVLPSRQRSIWCHWFVPYKCPGYIVGCDLVSRTWPRFGYIWPGFEDLT